MAIESSDIEALGTSPKKTVTDEGLVEERPIKEVVEADRYAASKAITAVPWGMRIAKVRNPSAS